MKKRVSIRRLLSSNCPRAVRRVLVSLGFLRPATIGIEKGADFYDDAFLHVEQYNVHYTKSNYYYLWCVLVDRIIRSDRQFVLDIGCGPGQVASFMHDRGLPAYFGVDLSAVAVDKARLLCPSYQFKSDNAVTTDLISTVEYDTVISLEFLEHVNDDLVVINRIRPGSRFLGTVPDFPYISHVRHFNSTEEVALRYGEFFNSFTVDEFKDPTGRKRYFLMDGVKV